MSGRVSFSLSEPDEIEISGRLYGHFAEHLGRCCYEGLWVGPDSPIPNTQGFRTDALEALKAMPTPLLRWPGGCYADHYHWRDGIGSPGQRPTRLGLSCGLSVVDDNALGTHEFLSFCEAIGAEPYLAGNMGSGSVQELCDWVEYCNCDLPTTLAKDRAGNGRPSPFGVRLWGVGNENWGCGGNYEPESYGLEYRRYASMLRHVDPNAELVVCGHNQEWNERLVSVLKSHPDLVDHFSIHRYWLEGGPGTGFSEAQYYASLKEAEETEDAILAARTLLDLIDPDRRIGIALDEWGVWHPEARSWGPDALGDCSGEYFQAATLRDAIQAAIAFEVFHRQAEVLSLANLAQIANVLHAPLQTQGSDLWPTPTYHLLKMHARHIGNRRTPVSVLGSPDIAEFGPAVSATASSGEEGAVLTVINRSLSDAVELSLPNWASRYELLSASSPDAQNEAAHPNQVSLLSAEVDPLQPFIQPAYSVATFFR